MSEHPVVACYRGLDSAHAVQFGALLADAFSEPLVLATAYHYEPLSLSARQQRSDNGRRAGAAHARLRDAHTLAGSDVAVRKHIVPFVGIVDALIALAEDIDACVLVLGRDTQGHVARALVPRAPCPVIVAPPTMPGARSRPLERIGVAYDRSPAARTALVAAEALALATGARLVVLAAGQTTEYATSVLRDVPLSLPCELDLETHALVGDASRTLTRMSGELDLLVCGSHGRRRPLAAILGSVSAHLIAHARCPVLVVPPASVPNRDSSLGVSSARIPASTGAPLA